MGDDDTDLSAGDLPDGIPDFCSSGHGVGREEYHHPVLDVALVNPGTHPDVAAGDFGEGPGMSGAGRWLVPASTVLALCAALPGLNGNHCMKRQKLCIQV